jgi:hypothetical protein
VGWYFVKTQKIYVCTYVSSSRRVYVGAQLTLLLDARRVQAVGCGNFCRIDVGAVVLEG